jgi:hypothetical protein
VLVAVGRSPNGKVIEAPTPGVAVTDRGFIDVDKQMRTNVPHIYAIGDIVGSRCSRTRRCTKAHVAAEARRARSRSSTRARFPSVAYTDPKWRGPGSPRTSARSRASSTARRCSRGPRRAARSPTAATKGFTKLLFDEATHRCIGGGIVGTHAGDLIGEVCLAVEMGADPVDIGKTIHPHPTLSESIGMAAELFEGVCTGSARLRKRSRRRSWRKSSSSSDALEYHEFPTPGKISIAPTKTLANQRDLSLAYSPGVAYACTAIQHDPSLAARYTAKANLVAVITNGSAVLGLGNIGALAGKPVMEGKGCLFKKFAGIDVFDIEIGESDPDKIVEVGGRARAHVRRHQPRGHQGARVLLHREEAARAHEDPVFHDDQHGTAIVARPRC